ncbi:patatin-like phospholipase family protein [Clostridium sp.]|jgi:NTE family protein|uniref:patatin-like phospholipase family protein n=1 Tax=Clostridium sp. TaxID=1506 RepID=UPI0039F45254
MKIDAVFEGGGVKGIALVGAVCCLENRGYKFENLAGTSAGAIVAALLAAGYTGEELKDIILQVNYTKFLEKSILDKFKITSYFDKIIGLLKDKGIYSGDPIEGYMEELLKKKGKVKFRDVSRNGKSYLKIIASDITRGDMIILPDDLIFYGIDPLDFSIAKAVRMSIGIPLFFKPVKLKHKTGISLIVDGGILSNYPIWIFDGQGEPKWPTLGLKLIEDNQSLTAKGKTDLISFIIDIVSAMLNKNEEIYVKHKDWVRTIGIPTLGVKGTEFDKISTMGIKLFESGYKSAEKFLKDWSFTKYKRLFTPH